MESRVLARIRRCSLWVAIATATALAILLVLWAWGAFNLTDIGPLGGFGMEAAPVGLLGGGDIFTAWAKLIFSLAVVADTAFAILLSLLVASRVKKGKG